MSSAAAGTIRADYPAKIILVARLIRHERTPALLLAIALGVLLTLLWFGLPLLHRLRHRRGAAGPSQVVVIDRLPTGR